MNGSVSPERKIISSIWKTTGFSGGCIKLLTLMCTNVVLKPVEKKYILHGKKKSCVVFFWGSFDESVLGLSQGTGVTFLMRQTFLCVQAMWLNRDKMWIWSTIGLLLFVRQEKEGRAGKSYSAEVGWKPLSLAAQPARAFVEQIGLILQEGRQWPLRHRTGAGLWLWCVCQVQIWMMEQEVQTLHEMVL